MLTPLKFFVLQLETQVIDNDLSESQMKTLIKKNRKVIDFVEPQSMNYDKKINEAFKEFVEKQKKIKETIKATTHSLKPINTQKEKDMKL